MSYNPYQWYLDVTLMALNGPFKGVVYSIDEKSEFVFGRDPECTLAVANDETISPRHFKIIVETPVVWLRDCGSDGGVFVKRQFDFWGLLCEWYHYGGPSAGKEEEAASCLNTFLLCDRDLIRLGDYMFLLRLDMPVTCIECGDSLAPHQKLVSEFVGDL